jgi:hypothetical protein
LEKSKTKNTIIINEEVGEVGMGRLAPKKFEVVCEY